ncbi:peptidase C1A papain [Labilithrix luteola]|uniref:Peptidase C1A papain n=1 Tax=Labilithrix luteola TaxID=1391654 RepID=A0A0K1PKQ0_9BACT|nr:C1 family peptidase [Labilithrix luteola]AKU94113.1 peptidase C1A papain [Labilithrix luteola]
MSRTSFFLLLTSAVLTTGTLACKRVLPAADDAGPAPVASKELGAPKTPPRPRAAPPIPPLPDLPILEKQEASAKLPFGITLPVRASASGCGGATWNGAMTVAIPCAQNGLLFGREEQGARELVSPRLLKGNAAALPRVVDNRFVALEGPVRDQRSSPACTAFSLATAIDHAVARWTGKPSNVSAMQIWSRYRSPYAQKAIGANLGQSLASETSWPFDERTAKGWVACEPGSKPPKEGCGLLPDPKRVASANADESVMLTDVTYLTDPDVDDLREHLAAGQDVVVALELPQVFAATGRPGARYVPHWTAEKAEGGHAVVLAGYVTLANAVYFLLHNSWGTAWGDGGYAWIHATTLMKHLREALVVDAEPVLRDAQKRRRTRGALTCDPGLVPDSIRSTCTPPCPDGSPRSDGVCPVQAQCGAGLVNLTGVCVIAAPTTKGSDPKTGIAWSCGPGGCSYDLPRRSDPDCKGNLCKASCPAPIFRIAASGDALTCVE